MKHILILILAFALVGCYSSKQIATEHTTVNNDSTSVNLVDSTAIHSIVNDSMTVEENTTTTIQETITETVKDSTNNIVIDRTIERKITQNSGKVISSVINEESDTTYINKEKTLETKDNKAIQQHNEDKKESNNLKYIFYISIVILIIYIIFKFKR